MDFIGKRNRDNALNGISFAIECVVSIAPQAEVHSKFIADIIFKTFITLLKLAIRT